MHARPAQVIDLQANSTRCFVETGILFFELTSHHHLDQRIFGQRRHFAFGNKLAVAEYRHVIANFEDLFHAVGDIDNPAPLGF
ncbi:hypothetical protein D3C80_138710 [compost metagenome]